MDGMKNGGVLRISSHRAGGFRIGDRHRGLNFERHLSWANISIGESVVGFLARILGCNEPGAPIWARIAPRLHADLVWGTPASLEIGRGHPSRTYKSSGTNT